MSAPEPGPPQNDQLMEEAAAWFARMRGPDADTNRDAFEAWLRRGALHRQAYNRASEIFAMGKLLGEADTPPPVRPGPALTARRLLVPLAAMLVLAAVAWLALGNAMQDPGPKRIADGPATPAGTAGHIATGRDESRSARLEDGSLVSLGAASRVDIRYDRDVRRLVLEQGMARFSVAHESRPLVVEAEGVRVRALGTLFEVGIAADRRVTVRLIRGSVEVTPPAGGAPRLLSPGQSLTFAGRRRNPGDEPADGSGTGGGQPAAGGGSAIDYDNVSVAELVAAANRNSRRIIRLADPAIGLLRVSGRFSIANLDLLAERLASLFGLIRAHDAGGDIVLSRR